MKYKETSLGGLALSHVAKMGSRGPQDAEGRHDVDVEHSLELLIRGLLNYVVPRVTGVVDDDVETAQFADSAVDELLGKGRIGEVSGKLRGSGYRFRGFFQWGRIEVVQHDGRTRRGELLRNGTSDTPAGSGNEGYFGFQ